MITGIRFPPATLSRLEAEVKKSGKGLKPGQVIGETAADGDGVVERPVTPAELLATIYRALGVDPAKECVHDDGKTRLLPAGTKAVAEALR